MVTVLHYSFYDDNDFFHSLFLKMFLLFFLLYYILFCFGKRLQGQKEDINEQGNECDEDV